MVKLSHAAEIVGFFVEVSKCDIMSNSGKTYLTTKGFEIDSILAENIGA
jgi:hypothetical protein